MYCALLLLPVMGFGKDGRGVIVRMNEQQALGTLGAVTAILAKNFAFTEDFRCISVNLDFTMSNLTLGQGPIGIYLANGNMSVAEVAETLTVQGPLGPNAQTENEQAMRPVYRLGVFGHGEVLAEHMHFSSKRNIRWTFSNPDGISIFAFNHSTSSALSTTDPVVNIMGDIFGVWVV